MHQVHYDHPDAAHDADHCDDGDCHDDDADDNNNHVDDEHRLTSLTLLPLLNCSTMRGTSTE